MLVNTNVHNNQVCTHIHIHMSENMWLPSLLTVCYDKSVFNNKPSEHFQEIVITMAELEIALKILKLNILTFI